MKGGDRPRALPFSDSEKLLWTGVLCPIAKQTATRFDAFYKQFAPFGTANRLVSVQNIKDYVQLFKWRSTQGLMLCPGHATCNHAMPVPSVPAFLCTNIDTWAPQRLGSLPLHEPVWRILCVKR